MIVAESGDIVSVPNVEESDFSAPVRRHFTVFVEAGKIHEDINNGTTPVKLIAANVVEKGKPLTSPAP